MSWDRRAIRSALGAPDYESDNVMMVLMPVDGSSGWLTALLGVVVVFLQLVQKTIQPCKNCLKDASVEKKDINEVSHCQLPLPVPSGPSQ
jgi:hypothetical protein